MLLQQAPHPMEVAIWSLEVPVVRDVPRQDTQVRQPVSSAPGPSEDHHDTVVVSGNERLGVVDCIKGALAGCSTVGLAKC